MSEQPDPERTPPEQPDPEKKPGGQSSPLREQAEPTPRRSWTTRVRGLSTTSKVIYGGAAVFVAAVLVIALTGLASGNPRAKTGPAPLAKGFTLPELGDPGHTVSLQQYAGRPVIINFFASWCTNCKTETPMIASFYKRMAGKVLVLGIDSEDEQANALKFMRASGVAYPVGFDPTNQSITDAYGVYGIPQTFFLNAQHRIVKHVSGAVTLKELTQGVALMDATHQPATAAAGPSGAEKTSSEADRA
jgi:cytochrome c biogenesis protein CcmG, thiol:disulfide interchange protein DsbE